MAPPSKKRKLAASTAPEEITFDERDREDYLTGFHKRKQQRIKHAQEQAVKRAQEEKIRDRKEMRQRRQQQLEEHVKAVNDAVRRFTGSRSGAVNGWEDEDEEGESGGDEGQEGDWEGLGEVPPINREDEYVDEEKYTTVTVESVEVGRGGLYTVAAESGDSEGEEDIDGGPKDPTVNGMKTNGVAKPANPASKRVWTKEKPGTADGQKKKKKKFRYERGETRKEKQKRERFSKKKDDSGGGDERKKGPQKGKKPKRR